MSITGSVDLGNGKFAYTIDHNPQSVATNAPMGSLFVDASGNWWRKLDDGSTTNVRQILDSSTILTSGFNESITRISVDGFTVGGGSGFTVVPKAALLDVRCGAQSGRVVYCYSQDRWWKLIQAPKLCSIEWIIYWFSHNVNQTWWWRMGQNFANPPSETDSHWGFKLINGRIWASSANGTNQQITDTGYNIPNYTTSYGRERYRADLTPGVSVKFYINDTLYATHSTYIPPAGADPLLIFFGTTSESTAKEVYFGRVVIINTY